MEEPRRQFVPGLGVLLLSAILLGIVGALLHDFRGVSNGRVGALLWAGGVLITFVLGTAYLSRRVLPLLGNSGWGEGFRLLWRSYLMGVNALLTGVRHEPLGAVRPKKTAADALPRSFRLLGAGFLFSHEAASITRGNSFVRAAGPGLVLLQPGETIAKVFDLRTQSRKQAVSATTRDGIPVTTSVSVTFHVRRLSPNERRPRSVETDAVPYPYDRQALFDLTYASAVAGDSKMDWTEQVAPAAATLLVGEIGRYTLDQLLVSGGAAPLGEIKASIKSGLEAMQQSDDGPTLPKGIAIVSVGVGALEMPTDVMLKRLGTWQAKWQTEATKKLTEGGAERQRLINRARALVLSENIDNLLTSIEATQSLGQSPLPEIILSQVVTALEGLSTNQAARTLPENTQWLGQASDASREIRHFLESEE